MDAKDALQGALNALSPNRQKLAAALQEDNLAAHTHSLFTAATAAIQQFSENFAVLDIIGYRVEGMAVLPDSRRSRGGWNDASGKKKSRKDGRDKRQNWLSRERDGCAA